MLIEKNLQEKLQIFAFFTENLTGVETPQKRLLLRGDASDRQQGETLIMGAIKDGKRRGLKGPILFHQL
jgi:hypothetical protein